MDQTKVIDEGAWIYAISGDRCVATHQDGTVIETMDIVDARRCTYELGRTRAAQQRCTYSLAGGPGRAITGNRRYTQKFAA